jgi:hypothetical protein
VILDRAHRAWAALTIAAAALSTAAYVAYARGAPSGPRGGSATGLAFGAVALALMLFAGLLGARRALRTWRLGRASTWLKGHVWLSILAALLALFHAGFRMGGPMTTWLMALLAAVTVSGLIGIALQNVLPRLMMELVPLETVYEQIPQVVEQLRAEADARVTEACGPLDAAGDAAAEAPGARLRETYLREIRPFLDPKLDRKSRLAQRSSADLLFAHLRTLLPAELHEPAADLASICEERRQLGMQARLHLWLHGWILAHAPLSYALLVLAAAHAVIALRY